MSEIPLAQAIENELKAHPSLDDKTAAENVYRARGGTGEYGNVNPSPAYVGKIRKRVAIEQRETKVSVPEPPVLELERQEGEDGPGEEPPTVEPFTPETFAPPPAKEEIPQGEPKQPSLFNGERVIRAGFGAVAAWTGWEGWRLNPRDEDDAAFIEASERMIEKYGPDVIEQFGDEIMFVVTATGSLGHRIRDFRARNQPKTETPAPVKDGPPATTPPPPEATKPDVLDQNISAPPEPERVLPTGAKAFGEDEFKRRMVKP